MNEFFEETYNLWQMNRKLEDLNEDEMKRRRKKKEEKKSVRAIVAL